MLTVVLGGLAWLALLGGILFGVRLRQHVERDTFGGAWRAAVQRRDRLAEQEETGTD